MTAEDLLAKVMRTYGPNALFIPEVTEEGAIEAMKEYARIMCAEQRGICAREVGMEINHGWAPKIDKGSILNAPEPKYD